MSAHIIYIANNGKQGSSKDTPLGDRFTIKIDWK